MSLFAGTNRLNSVPGQLIILVLTRKTQLTYISELHMHCITILLHFRGKMRDTDVRDRTGDIYFIISICIFMLYKNILSKQTNIPAHVNLFIYTNMLADNITHYYQ